MTLTLCPTGGVWNVERSSLIGKKNITKLQMDFTLAPYLQDKLMKKLIMFCDEEILKYTFDASTNSVLLFSDINVEEHSIKRIQCIIDDIEWEQIELENDWRNIEWASIE